MKSDNVNDT